MNALFHSLLLVLVIVEVEAAVSVEAVAVGRAVLGVHEGGVAVLVEAGVPVRRSVKQHIPSNYMHAHICQIED